MKKVFLLSLAAQFSLFASWSAPVDVYTSQGAENPVVGVDNSGNAVIAFSAIAMGSVFSRAVQFSNGVVSNPQDFNASAGSTIASANSIAVNGSGNALLAFYQQDTMSTNNYVSASILTSGVWSPVSTLSDFTTTSVNANFPIGVALSSSNQATAVWPERLILGSAFSIKADLNNAGVWQGEQTIFPSTPSTDFLSGVVCSSSPSGQVIATWVHTASSTLQAAYYNGTSWTTNASISANVAFDCIPPLSVSMNSSGNALILWHAASTRGIASSLFSSGSYGAAQDVYIPGTGVNVFDFSVALDSSGNGVAIWSILDTNTSTYSILASAYRSGIWQTPATLDTVSGGTSNLLNSVIQVDLSGNAIAVWQKTDAMGVNRIFTSNLSNGGSSWGANTQLSTESTSAQNPSLSVNGSGQAVAAWFIGSVRVMSTIQAVYGQSFFAPSPAQNLIGSQILDRFLTQTDRVNVLSWSPSADPSVVSYSVYRGGQLIGTVPASSSPSYRDHHSSKAATTYQVTAVNSTGAQSTPLTLVLP